MWYILNYKCLGSILPFINVYPGTTFLIMVSLWIKYIFHVECIDVFSNLYIFSTENVPTSLFFSYTIDFFTYEISNYSMVFLMTAVKNCWSYWNQRNSSLTRVSTTNRVTINLFNRNYLRYGRNGYRIIQIYWHGLPTVSKFPCVSE